MAMIRPLYLGISGLLTGSVSSGSTDERPESTGVDTIPLTFDITSATVPGDRQEILVAVWDPTSSGSQPRGIWYTPTTGIWQTVWLEGVSSIHIGGLKMVPDIDSGQQYQCDHWTSATSKAICRIHIQLRLLQSARSVKKMIR